MLFYVKFENILQGGGDDLCFISLGAIGSVPLWYRSLATLCILNHTFVWCLGAALSVMPQGASEASLYRAVTTLPYRDFRTASVG